MWHLCKIALCKECEWKQKQSAKSVLKHNDLQSVLAHSSKQMIESFMCRAMNRIKHEFKYTEHEMAY